MTPAGTAGAVDVVLTTPGGAVTSTGGYTYVAAPAITLINPDNGPVAGGTLVTINGSNLTDTTGVTFGGAAGTSVTVVNDSQVTVVTPAGTAGAVDVVLTTPGGAVTSTGGYTYVTAPAITTINPDNGPVAGGTLVTINGSNLTGTTGVTFGGTAGTSVTVVNDSQVTVVTPAGTATGAVDVTLTAPQGTATVSGGYTYTVAVGDSYLDGIVYQIDGTGTSGSVVSTTDINGNWSAAGSACSSMTPAGDWSLPSYTVLQSVATALCPSGTSCNYGGFLSSNYWSSTESNPDLDAYVVQFPSGALLSDVEFVAHPARCVRAFTP